MSGTDPDVSLFESSVLKDPEADYVPQSRMLDPSSFKDMTVPNFSEQDFQSQLCV